MDPLHRQRYPAHRARWHRRSDYRSGVKDQRDDAVKLRPLVRFLQSHGRRALRKRFVKETIRTFCSSQGDCCCIIMLPFTWYWQPVYATENAHRLCSRLED